MNFTFTFYAQNMVLNDFTNSHNSLDQIHEFDLVSYQKAEGAQFVCMGTWMKLKGGQQ